MGRRSGRRADPVRVVAAGLGGTAERCVIGRGITDVEALAEIAEEVGALPAERRQEALDYAAASYTRGNPAFPQNAAVAALLVRAGADLERARAIAGARSGGFTVGP